MRVFFIDIVAVRGQSMVPSAGDGSLAFVFRCAYGFPRPDGKGYMVMYAQPLPGDTVVAMGGGSAKVQAIKRVFDIGPAYIRVQDGMLYGRGGELPMAGSTIQTAGQSSYISPGQVFITGDNPALSYDSRYYGSIPIENIRGKVLFLVPNPFKALGRGKRN